MEQPGFRIFAYGVVSDAASYECVDCGHRLEHGVRGRLPPCPRYRDSTHSRAAWRHGRDREALDREIETSR
jgi:hypothetical protein